MLLDNDLRFSNEQAITSDAASTNVVNLGANAALDRGKLRIRAVVHTAFDGTSMNFKVQGASDAAFTSPVELHASGAVVAATLVAGYVAVDIPFPATSLPYIRMYYDGTGSITTGKVTAHITEGTPTTATYADASETFEGKLNVGHESN